MQGLKFTDSSYITNVQNCEKLPSVHTSSIELEASNNSRHALLNDN